MWFCLVAALGGLALTPVAANAHAQWYQLRVKYGQKCLGVFGGITDGKDNIVASQCNPNNVIPFPYDQTWNIAGDWSFSNGQRGLDTSGFTLMARHSGKMMDIHLPESNPWVVQKDYESGDLSHVWKFVHVSTEDGIRWYQIKNAHSGMCLGVYYDLDWIWQEECLTDNQLWRENQLWRADVTP